MGVASSPSVTASPASVAAPCGVAIVAVEANVGGASGGHLALRVGEYAYHYQCGADGRLALERDPWSAFVEEYAQLGNRGLHLAPIHLLPDDGERVADGLAARLVSQRLNRARATRLDDDLAWLEALAEGRPAPALRGAGLLAHDGPPRPYGLRLAALATERCGTEALVERRRSLEAALADAARAAAPTDVARLRERLQEREALAAWAAGRGLAEGVVVEIPDQPPLSPGERVALMRWAAELEGQLLALLDSDRPDRGFALLVLLARCHAVDRSLRSGRLVLLDVWPDQAVATTRLVLDDARHGAALEGRARALLDGTRVAVLTGGPLDENRFNRLEECASRLVDLRRGLAGQPLRSQEGRLLPSRGRVLHELPRPRDDALTAALQQTRARALALARELDASRAYDLVDANCVTALLDDLAGCFPDADAAAAALGGRLDAHAGLVFIPHRALAAVQQSFAVEPVEHLPNHRAAELDRCRASEPDLLVALREGNAWTSTIYTPRLADGAFLFFTDDVLLPRPLFGALNLVYGLGAGALGLATAPFDDGELLSAGLRGALFSLPELLFVNIRKGSFAYLPRPSPEPGPAGAQPIQPMR